MGELKPRAAGRVEAVPYLLLAPNALWLAMFMAGAIVMLAGISLHVYEAGKGILDVWSVENYAKFLGDPFYRDVLWRTLALGAWTTAGCLLLGFPLAFLLSRLRGMRRSILYFVLLLPLLTSAVVRTFGWMILLGNNGFINRTLIALGIVDEPVRMMYSMTGIVIALVEVLLPFMVLALDAALLNIDPHLYEAAQNLGARRPRIFVKVTLPLVLPCPCMRARQALRSSSGRAWQRFCAFCSNAMSGSCMPFLRICACAALASRRQVARSWFD